MTTDLPPQGTIVTAKRAGWNEVLTDEQLYDRDPYEYVGDDDLRGPIAWRDVPDQEFVPAHRVVLVSGQFADPSTVKGEADGANDDDE